MTEIQGSNIVLRNVDRSELTVETDKAFPIPWEAWRDAGTYSSNLPGTALSPDLGLIDGTFGTKPPSLQTEDLKAEAGNPTSNSARAHVPIPAEYVAGRSVSLRFSAGMLTTVSDTAATLDVEARKVGRDYTIGSELYTGAAVSINSLTLSDKTFSLTVTDLNPGDVLDVKITTAVNDGATGTEVKAIVARAELLCDIRG